MPQVRRSGQIISKGKDKWLVRVCLGRDTATGKRIYESQTVRGTKRNAQAALNEKLALINRGQYLRKAKTSLREYLNEWLLNIVKLRVRQTTFESYKYHLEHYLYGRIGDRVMESLTTFDIQRFYNDLRSAYSPRTVQYVHAILNSALKKAVEMRFLRDNPCTFAELPKKVKDQIKVFAPDEARRFLEAAANFRHGLIFEFALVTGARPEEYLAAKWADFDAVRQTVSLQRTLSWKRGGGWELSAEMKTAMSRRTIPLRCLWWKS